MQSNDRRTSAAQIRVIGKSRLNLHTVDDILRQLGTKRENFVLLLTDAARYMSLAGKTLKELHRTLMQVTCIAYLYYITALCEFVLSSEIFMT